MHSLILPARDCHRLGHALNDRLKQPGPGKITYCVVCSLGHEMAMATFGNEAKADEFVQALRREDRAGPLHNQTDAYFQPNRAQRRARHN